MNGSNVLELIRWAISIIIPAAAGLIGVIVGAYFVGRHERWRFKRDVYLELLRSLMKVKRIGIEMLAEEQRPPSAEDGAARREKLSSRHDVALDQLSEAMVAAVLLLGDESMKALSELRAWEGTDADENLAAIDRAFKLLTTAGKRDLGL